jgi:hypothetical protein
MKVLWGHDERGEKSIFLITTVIFAILTIGLGVGFGWSYFQMVDYKDNSDQKVETAVTSAKTEQEEMLRKQFDEDYKLPNNVFTGPADYGSVSFEYPKTWSVYIADDSKDSNEYLAYFHPVAVPPVNDERPYALRVIIVNRRIDEVLERYEAKIEDRKLKSSPVNLTDADTDNPKSSYGRGIRLNGQFSETINGSAVLYDIRGRTLMVAVDNKKFMKDFDNTILKTLKYRD